MGFRFGTWTHGLPFADVRLWMPERNGHCDMSRRSPLRDHKRTRVSDQPDHLVRVCKRSTPFDWLAAISGKSGELARRSSTLKLHIEQRTYGISTGTGSLELSVILFSPEIFTSNATSETATPSEHDAITRTSDPSLRNDLTVHF